MMMMIFFCSSVCLAYLFVWENPVADEYDYDQDQDHDHENSKIPRTFYSSNMHKAN